MILRNLTISVFLVFLVGITVMGLVSTIRAADDFTPQIIVNGKDISGMETVVVDPEQGMEIDLRIINGDRDLTLRAILMAVVFANSEIITLREPLLNFRMVPGEVRDERIVVDLKDALKAGNGIIATGIYRSRFSLEYTVAGKEELWHQVKNIKIPGNPLVTPAGAAGAAFSLGAVAAIIALVKTITAPGLAAGTILPAGASVHSLSGLYEFLNTRLESTTRGRVVGSIVNSAKKRIIRQKCPVCQSRIKHGYCYTCGKSVKDLRKEYIDRLKNLSIQCGQLLSSGRSATMEEICSALDVNEKVATDVIATLKHVGLIRVKGITRKITGKAVTAGICSGISTVIWITVGGFAVLSTATLITILVAAIAVPFAVAKSLQVRAKHAIARNMSKISG